MNADETVVTSITTYEGDYKDLQRLTFRSGSTYQHLCVDYTSPSTHMNIQEMQITPLRCHIYTPPQIPASVAA